MRAVLALAAFLLPAAATAQPAEFPRDWTNARVMACDTLEQVTSLLDTWRDHGVDAHRMLYASMRRLTNAEGEPLCGAIVGGMRGVEQHAAYHGLAAPGMGLELDAYVVEIETVNGRSFYAWVEAPLAEPG